MTDESTRHAGRVSGPLEYSERLVEASEATVDAHEQFLQSWHTSLEAQRTLLAAWTTALGGHRRRTRRETGAVEDSQPAARIVDRDGDTPTADDRLYALERRQDALERKLDRILEAIEESDPA